MVGIDNSKIELNLIELLRYLCDIGVADSVQTQNEKITAFTSASSAWPHLAISQNDVTANDIAELPELVKGQLFPPLLLIGDAVVGMDDFLADAGFRKISFWKNMYLNLDNFKYTSTQTVSVREISTEEIDEWLIVAATVLFTGKLLDKNIFTIGREKGLLKMFGAYSGLQLVGTLMVFLGDMPGVYMVAVNKEYRKRGIASELMAYTANHLQQRGYEAVVLHSTIEGYRFYQNLGFEETGKIDLYYYINKN